MTTTNLAKKRYYVYLDEGGNFDFSNQGTKYLTITAVVASRPFFWDEPLLSLKYDLLEEGYVEEYLHATEDKQDVRNRVYNALAQGLSHMKLHSIIIEKRKTQPNLQVVEIFYPMMLDWILRYLFQGIRYQRGTVLPDVLVITDRIPVNKKRSTVEKTIKQTLANIPLPALTYRVLHHESKSCFGLQVADYCNWAIYKKWTDGDSRSYKCIQAALKGEYDIFQVGQTYYY